MSILNVMWSGDSAFASVHKVHLQILAQVEPATTINTWLLQGSARGCVAKIGETREWHLSSNQLKGKRFWKLLTLWIQARFYHALNQSDVRVLLLDGLGTARALLPVLKKLPQLRAVVLFHGATRISAADRKSLSRLPASQLTLAAVSQTLANALEADLQIPVITLRSALDPLGFRSRLLSREQARARLQLPVDSTPVVGAVGRLVGKKGFACLIEAFAEALIQRPQLRLVIIGEGQARAALEAQVNQLGLRDKVLLPGNLDDAATLYRAFDWVAIPSLEEGLGLILQEAVMAGVPVLASELAVFREQLAEAGCYVATEDATAWSEALIQAFSVASVSVAAAQSTVLSPDDAWLDFSQVARRLLSCSE
ncbi:glycosyl transferase [Pseudomonas frederiksbergensis]|uniref:Glycosyl transferase n=1 Tax=Pseudomonas frederiksbergensis TaxID=104087 RepID=A0A1J0EJJ2_9PSED|nr:glycosyltransferase [Pseudomonas frederiksbergensis]APC16274.1 glycosyl transferase [Pseudomonas frederiksbergensis]